MPVKPTILALALSLSLAACASAPSEQPARDLGGLVYQGTDRVIDAASSVLSREKPFVVATTVNVDDLASSSTFGRLAAQLVSTRLSQRGYLVRDVTYTRALVVTPETGEMVLSREATRIAQEADAQAVLAGVYAVGGEKIYLNIRMLSAIDGRVLSSVDLVLPLDEDTRRMVTTGRGPGQRPTVSH